MAQQHRSADPLSAHALRTAPGALYGDVGRVRGVVLRLGAAVFRRRWHLDLRVHVEARPGDPDSAFPTRKGVRIPVERLPQLLQLMLQAGADAVRRGHIRAEAFTSAGITLPELPAMLGAPPSATAARQGSTRREAHQAQQAQEVAPGDSAARAATPARAR